MKGLENQEYLLGFILSNVLAILFLLCSIKLPRVARILFFILFSWAFWMNWTTSRESPTDYLDYADLSLINWYGEFIRGWFSNHISFIVGGIAVCQALIGVSMLLKSWWYKLGCIGAIIFLLSIAPLGVGSGFPCTLILSVAMAIMFKKGNYFIWDNPKYQRKLN
jgi:hypothetical protein